MNSKTIKLGKEVKKLEFKILKVSKNRNIPLYHIVVARKRSASSSRLDKVGFFHFAKRYYQRTRLLGLDFKKMQNYIIKGATFHKSVFKFII